MKNLLSQPFIRFVTDRKTVGVTALITSGVTRGKVQLSTCPFFPQFLQFLGRTASEIKLFQKIIFSFPWENCANVQFCRVLSSLFHGKMNSKDWNIHFCEFWFPVPRIFKNPSLIFHFFEKKLFQLLKCITNFPSMIIKEVVAGIQGDNWDCYSNRRYFLASSCSMLKPYLMAVVQLFKRMEL